MSPGSLLALLLLLAAVLMWFLGVGRRRPPPDEPDDETDWEMLGEAEHEVRGPDAFASPDDADEIADWGPGTPKR